MRSPALHLVHVRLDAVAPWSPSGALGHVVATGVPGCEEVRDGWYRRSLQLASGPGIIAVRPTDDGAECRLWLRDETDEPAAVAACRRLLDLDAGPGARADPWLVTRVLASDPALRPVVEGTPGQRLPRSVDAEELAVRAVLGQQVSTAAARTLARRLLVAHGSELPTDPGGGLTHVWPSPRRLLALDEGSLGMPASRRRTLVTLVRALAQGHVDLSPTADPATARSQLAQLPGIGPWTVELVALRGLGDPDAFPVTDLGVRRAMAAVSCLRRAVPVVHAGPRGEPGLAIYRRCRVTAAVQTTVVQSPVGPLVLGESQGELVGLRLPDVADDGTLTTAPAPRWRPPGRPTPLLALVADQLAAYFAGELTQFELPLRLDGTTFQQRVWRALRDIPYGSTATYGQIAERLGSPGASRAVGLANNRNPVPIIVPCHRVVGVDGALVGFGGGLPCKRWLLDHESARDQLFSL